jgi:hypothetical protein
MTLDFTKAVVLAAAVTLSATGAARAETLDAKVPFPFVVHGQSMPAGEYRIENDGPVVWLRQEHGKAVAVVLGTTPARGHDPAGNTPVLIFTHDETQYRLADIWQSGQRGEAVPRF